MKLLTIDTELFKLDGGAMFGVVPKSIWQKRYPADEHNLCVWAMRSLLIEQQDRLILIDTGLGEKQSTDFFNHYFVDRRTTLTSSIHKAGYELSDITDVILTHLHFDHVGGAVYQKPDKQYALTFPNAIYWSNHTHWQEATLHPNPREKASFLRENLEPIRASGRLQWIDEKQNIPFCEGVRIQFMYGHTKAMMIPIITYQATKELAYVADLFPAIGHLPLAYVPAYDSNPVVSMVEKETFLKEALARNTVLFFEHEPFQECCSLQQTVKGIREKECFRLSEWVG